MQPMIFTWNVSPNNAWCVVHVRFIGLCKDSLSAVYRSKSRQFISLQTSNGNVLLRAISTIGIFPRCRAMYGWNRQHDLDEGRPWCIMGQEGVFGSVEGRNLMLACFNAYTEQFGIYILLHRKVSALKSNGILNTIRDLNCYLEIISAPTTKLEISESHSF